MAKKEENTNKTPHSKNFLEFKNNPKNYSNHHVMKNKHFPEIKPVKMGLLEETLMLA